MSRISWKPELVKLIMRFAVSAAILIFSFIVILGGYPDDYVKAAIGFIGIVIGYWLR